MLQRSTQRYQTLKAMQAELQAEIHRLQSQLYYLDAWIDSSKPGGNARGSPAPQYRLRSRQPIFNGRKSRYLRPAEVAEVRAAIARGRSLQQHTQALEQIAVEIQQIEHLAKATGLALPKLNSFQALTQSKSNEWYTKPRYIELARTVLGAIDLDPATCPTAQKWIQATTFYTQEDDGFNRSWFGCMWLNPPYGAKAGTWMLKAIAEYESGNVQAAILLVRGDSKGMKALKAQFPCCEPNHRLCFIDASGQEGKRPIPGYHFFYLGPDVDRFKQVFSAIGMITQPA
ncbi:DNA N-6-adenine-methyltransferase [Halomicronema sp. CCY15110]|uniref:DNA N-6-adenine-methyltransferase n=1 Tax=Halomicronema sp. CCY15110 TaxID=2767773 RepID=UPI00194E864D|nr:DNA N-6-adenine-methyltransferase [Halomicronema sp. CCY15110]